MTKFYQKTLYQWLIAKTTFHRRINPNGHQAAELLQQIAIHLRAAERHHGRREYGFALIEVKATAALLRLAGVPEPEHET